MTKGFDIAFLGNYTKDTIISATGSRIVDGGALNYGAHVAAKMGLRVAAVTRLAQEDWHVVETLKDLGVSVYAEATAMSTCLRLEYPSSNPDERIITVTSSAGSFTPAQVNDIQAQAWVLGPSFRGEVGHELLEALVTKGATIAVDVQGWVRVVRDGVLSFMDWPQAHQTLAQVDILKTDAVEARALTGQADIHQAAHQLGNYGPREIVMTHRDGLLVLANGQFYEARFYPTMLIGRSGRGDTTLAAYVSKRLSSPPERATIWAAAVASLKMEAEGPFRQDIERVEELIQLKYGSLLDQASQTRRN